jgi:hypothetical protein
LSDHAPLHIQFKCNFSAKREETHSNNVSGEEYEFFKWNNKFKGALSAKINPVKVPTINLDIISKINSQ